MVSSVEATVTHFPHKCVYITTSKSRNQRYEC